LGKDFDKAKASALLVLENDAKRINKHYDKHPGHESNRAWSLKNNAEDVAKVMALKDFPVSSVDLKGVDVAAKAKIVKGHMEMEFPKAKISVRIERYSGGCSLNVKLDVGSVVAMSDDDVKKANKIVDLYEHIYASDPMTDLHNNDNYAFLVVNKAIGPGVVGEAMVGAQSVVMLK
jgi:hypothetical protein